MSRVLIVADPHCPCMHPRYVDFLRDTQRKWKTSEAVVIGDVADNHTCSLHTKDGESLSSADECRAAKVQIKTLYDAFPRALVCIGNHDERPRLRAAEVFLAHAYLRSYAEVWDTPGWTWGAEHQIDGVLYIHGTGSSGKNAHLNNAQANMMSLVQGHTHAFAGVAWAAGPRAAIFGMNVGCGLDPDSYAARYGINLRTRPVLGCGVVVDGEEAYFIKFDMGRKAVAGRAGRYRKA